MGLIVPTRLLSHKLRRRNNYFFGTCRCTDILYGQTSIAATRSRCIVQQPHRVLLIHQGAQGRGSEDLCVQQRSSNPSTRYFDIYFNFHAQPNQRPYGHFSSYEQSRASLAKVQRGRIEQTKVLHSWFSIQISFCWTTNMLL